MDIESFPEMVEASANFELTPVTGVWIFGIIEFCRDFWGKLSSDRHAVGSLAPSENLA